MSVINTVIDNLNIHYTDEGSGQPVLFLHGWGSSCDIWQSAINSLKDSCRLIALDFPGCGQSDILSQPWKTADYARLVVDFCKTLKLNNPILVGHSHGGRVIMYLCGNKLMLPPKIVLIDAAGLKPKKSFKKQIKVKAFKTVKRCLTLPILKKYTDSLLQKARSFFGSSDYNDAPEVMRKTLVSLVNDDMTDIVGNISCPTLLIWGDKDTDTPLYMANRLTELIKDTGLCVLEGTGHFSFVQKPLQANAILKSFLS